jgi:hypothetical protein
MANITKEDISCRIGSVGWTDKFNNLSKVINSIVVEYIYTKDEITVNHIKIYRTGSPSAANFTAYEDVTESMVLEWVHSLETEDDVENICDALESKWNEVNTPTEGDGRPWDNIENP